MKNYIDKKLEEFDIKVISIFDLHAEKCFGHLHDSDCPVIYINKFLTQTIKEILDCMPEERNVNVSKYENEAFMRHGYNTCRQQFIDNIKKI